MKVEKDNIWVKIWYLVKLAFLNSKLIFSPILMRFFLYSWKIINGVEYQIIYCSLIGQFFRISGQKLVVTIKSER